MADKSYENASQVIKGTNKTQSHNFDLGGHTITVWLDEEQDILRVYYKAPNGKSSPLKLIEVKTRELIKNNV